MKPCAWFGCIVLAGCGAAQSTRSREPAPVALDPPSPSTAVAEEESTPSRAPGPLSHAEVDALISHGLGPLLATVRLSPVFVRGHFAGFRLDAAQDLDAWHAAGADVRVGDVIVRVNGIRIERPEHALWAFERLRIADAIEVQLVRDGTPLTVRSPIVGATVARDG